MAYDTDYDPDLDATTDEVQLELDREQADLDAEADRYAYLDSFRDYFGARPLLIELADGTFTEAA